MNIIDYVIIGIVAVSVLFGLYRGFIATIVNTGGSLVSFGLSFWLGPKLADLLKGNTALVDMLAGYADVSGRLGDNLRAAQTSVQDLIRQGEGAIHDMVTNIGLPKPLESLLESNLTNQVFGDGASVQTVQDYLTQTILNACISVICYIAVFLVSLLLLTLLGNLLKAVFSFPVLKQMDSIAGGAFGILRGLLICFVLMAVVPLIQTLIPMTQVTELVENSTLASYFTNGTMIEAIMNGHL